MKSMGEDNGNGNGTSSANSEGAAAEGRSSSAAAGEAPQQPPLRQVDIEEVDDSAGGGDD